MTLKTSKNAAPTMVVGSHTKLPHYSVQGDKTSMYVWINEDGHGSSSQWLKGRMAFQIWNELERRFKDDKQAFIDLVKVTHKNHEKSDYR